MSRALVIDFHMPFAPRPEGLADIFSDDLFELFHKHELHATILLSGLFLQRAAKSRGVITALAALARDGKIELASEPLGAPLPGVASVSELAKLAIISKQWCESIFGTQIRTTCLDYRYPCGELLPLLRQQNLEHVIIAPLYPRRTHPRTSLQLRQLRGELRISVISQMSSASAVNETVEVLSLLPLSKLSANDRQSIYKGFTDWLRLDATPVVSLQEAHVSPEQTLSVSSIAEFSVPPKKGEFVSSDPAAAGSYMARVGRLKDEIAQYLEDTDTGIANETRIARLAEIDRFLAQASAGDGFAPSETGGFWNPRTREMLYDGLLRAQVAFDAERRPDVDPNCGWAEVHSPLGSKGEIKAPLVLDTQLMQLGFNPLQGGVLEAFEYKPRKISLQSVLGADGTVIPSLTERLVRIGPGVPPNRKFSVESRCTDARVTQRAGGVVVSRFVNSVSGAGSITLQKDVTVRAGIGGHLSNSTTGFSVEYSVEDQEQIHPELHLVIQCAILLPSAEPSAASLYPLMCVGGVSPSRHAFAETQLIASDKVPGGVYGARLIDTLQDFMVDLRTSRPLWGIFFEPVNSCPPGKAPMYQGSILSLVVPCTRLKGGLSGFNLFLSIM